MTQEEINRLFETQLGQQCLELYLTPDEKVFIRLSEAQEYCNNNNLEGEIQILLPEWG